MSQKTAPTPAAPVRRAPPLAQPLLVASCRRTRDAAVDAPPEPAAA